MGEGRRRFYIWIISASRKPLFLGERAETFTRMGFARAYILNDAFQSIYPGTEVKVNDTVIWQEFTHEYLERFAIHTADDCWG